MKLKVDPERLRVFTARQLVHDTAGGTGILVRAEGPNGWAPYDLAVLDRDSVLKWLWRRPQTHTVDVVLELLGHAQRSVVVLHPRVDRVLES